MGKPEPFNEEDYIRVEDIMPMAIIASFDEPARGEKVIAATTAALVVAKARGYSKANEFIPYFQRTNRDLMTDIRIVDELAEYVPWWEFMQICGAKVPEDIKKKYPPKRLN